MHRWQTEAGKRPRMPRKQRFSDRLLTASRWPLGVALTSWRYLWRTTPLHPDEAEGDLGADSPPPLPSELERSQIQEPNDAAGPLFDRVRLRRGLPPGADFRVHEPPPRLQPIPDGGGSGGPSDHPPIGRTR
jgi:hypothetical protein